MKIIILTHIIFYFFVITTFAQCPQVDFTNPSSVCIGENIDLENLTINGNSYSWDFCSGELNLLPDTSTIASSSAINRGRSIRMINDDAGIWYGFSLDQAGHG